MRSISGTPRAPLIPARSASRFGISARAVGILLHPVGIRVSHVGILWLLVFLIHLGLCAGASG